MSTKPKSIIDLGEDIEDITFDLPLKIDTVDLELPFDEPEIQSAPQTKNIDVSKIQNCPRCGKPLVRAIAINGNLSTSFLECPSCGTLVNTFKPTYYQTAYLKAPQRYKMGAGGFGTGKSRANIEDVIKHLLLIPNARVCVAARSYPALKGTFVKEFYSMFPAKLVKRKNDQDHELTLTNGSELLFRSFDDESKFKSMNLTMALMIEASDLVLAAFEMMQSRIRNTAAMIPEVDPMGNPIMIWNPGKKAYEIKYAFNAIHISLETNPDAGWVKTDFLLIAGTVEFYGDAYNEGYKFKKNKNPDMYIQVVSTSANPYLPPNYEAEQTRNKSRAYIQQYYKGSFNFSSNLVFPNFGLCIVPPHELPPMFDIYGKPSLFYCIGLDYGINDPTHVIFAAFSTITHKLYVFGELRMDDTDVKNIAAAYRKEFKINNIRPDRLLMQPKFDGRSYNKRESDLVTIGKMFEDEGLYFSPSFTQHEPRIIKMNSLINHDQMEIFTVCEFLIEEGLNYKFKLDKDGNPTKVPQDKKDHGITALEFIVVELPHNLMELSLQVYLPAGTHFKHDTRFESMEQKKKKVYDPLSEDKNVRNSTGPSYNLTVVGNPDTPNRTYGIYDQGNIIEESDDVNKPLGAYVPGQY